VLREPEHHGRGMSSTRPVLGGGKKSMDRVRSIMRSHTTARFAGLCLLLHMAFLMPFASYAEPRVNMTYDFYAVSGLTSFELNRQLIKMSPVRHNGKVLHGDTQWKIGYHYECNHEDGYWYVDRVGTTVDIRFTLPKWKDYRRAGREEQKRWDAYYRALLEHEQGHKEIAVKAARAIEDRLLNMQRMGDRADLDDKAREIAERVFRECNELQAQYDVETDHGRHRGVLLH
jgi:predicted secreted Zn-dependent protease